MMNDVLCGSNCEVCEVECNYKKRHEKTISMILPKSSFLNMNIESFKVPDGVFIIGERCFAESKLKKVFFNNTLIIMENAFEACDGLTDVNLSEVKVIKKGSFKSCKNLQSVEISSLKPIEISPYAFENCESLTDIWFGGTSDAWCDATNGQGVLWGCKTSVKIHCKDGTIENSITVKVNEDDYLEQVNITLEELHLEFEFDQVKGIGPGVCANMKFLKEFAAEEGFTGLDKKAFCNCCNLEKVTLPGSLECVKEGVFAGCDKLVAIFYKGCMEKFRTLIDGKEWIDHDVEIFCNDGKISYER